MTARSSLTERPTLHAPYLNFKLAIPPFLYGTAWKKERTTQLIFNALKNGFTGIDTACQPKHYREDLVGEGLRKALSEMKIDRSALFIQTKFTPTGGQDPKDIPYDPSSSLSEQVRSSLERSFHHLRTAEEHTTGNDTYLDSLVLHSPLSSLAETLEVWKTLESYVPQRIRSLGISNVSFPVLKELYQRSEVKPAIVQNRFFAASEHDVALRRYCLENQIVYQSFWTVTANPSLLRSNPVQELSNHLGVSREAALYCLILGLDNTVILNGTTSVKHMDGDWNAVAEARDFISSDQAMWQKILQAFKDLIGQSSQ